MRIGRLGYSPGVSALANEINENNAATTRSPGRVRKGAVRTRPCGRIKTRSPD